MDNPTFKETLQTFVQMIRTGNEFDARGILFDPTLDYAQREELVKATLNEKGASDDLIEVALWNFLFRKPKTALEHGYWVHSLSHFTKTLWQRRSRWAVEDCLKDLMQAAFQGALELGDANCCNRLVNDFVKNAKWDDDPAAFHLTPENLTWMDWKWFPGAKERIQARRFASEEAFLAWKKEFNIKDR